MKVFSHTWMNLAMVLLVSIFSPQGDGNFSDVENIVTWSVVNTC
ncbi:exported hypothetical protein [Planktothrix sp. PCC 11201]|nr:exported hypothetical protein [Planktothrix sp. PCC 11201]